MTRLPQASCCELQTHDAGENRKFCVLQLYFALPCTLEIQSRAHLRIVSLSKVSSVTEPDSSNYPVANGQRSKAPTLHLMKAYLLLELRVCLLFCTSNYREKVGARLGVHGVGTLINNVLFEPIVSIAYHTLFVSLTLTCEKAIAPVNWPSALTKATLEQPCHPTGWSTSLPAPPTWSYCDHASATRHPSESGPLGC